MRKYRVDFTNCQAPTYKFVNLTPPAPSCAAGVFSFLEVTP